MQMSKNKSSARIAISPMEAEQFGWKLGDKFFYEYSLNPEKDFIRLTPNPSGSVSLRGQINGNSYVITLRMPRLKMFGTENVDYTKLEETIVIQKPSMTRPHIARHQNKFLRSQSIFEQTKRPWTSEELQSLKKYSLSKTPVCEVAQELHRTQGAVRQKAFEHNLSMNSRGSSKKIASSKFQRPQSRISIDQKTLLKEIVSQFNEIWEQQGQAMEVKIDIAHNKLHVTLLTLELFE